MQPKGLQSPISPPLSLNPVPNYMRVIPGLRYLLPPIYSPVCVIMIFLLLFCCCPEEASSGFYMILPISCPRPSISSKYAQGVKQS